MLQFTKFMSDSRENRPEASNLDFSPTEVRRTSLVIHTEIKTVNDIKPVFEKFNAEIEAVEGACEEVLTRVGVEPGIKPFVLTEALNNSVLHGNFNDAAKTEDKYESAKIKVRESLAQGKVIPSQVLAVIEEFKNKVVLTIQDGGQGFNWREKMANLKEVTAAVARGELITSGRGLFLLAETFGLENLEFNDSGNILKITVPIPEQQKTIA
jgi:hypothetical protein